MAFHDKNVICDFMIGRKINYMMMWHVIPHHTNLGPSISMSLHFNFKKSSATYNYPK
jgi:hypothetical protein